MHTLYLDFVPHELLCDIVLEKKWDIRSLTSQTQMQINNVTLKVTEHDHATNNQVVLLHAHVCTEDILDLYAARWEHIIAIASRLHFKLMRNPQLFHIVVNPYVHFHVVNKLSEALKLTQEPRVIVCANKADAKIVRMFVRKQIELCKGDYVMNSRGHVLQIESCLDTDMASGMILLDNKKQCTRKTVHDLCTVEQSMLKHWPIPRVHSVILMPNVGPQAASRAHAMATRMVIGVDRAFDHFSNAVQQCVSCT